MHKYGLGEEKRGEGREREGGGEGLCVTWGHSCVNLLSVFVPYPSSPNPGMSYMAIRQIRVGRREEERNRKEKKKTREKETEREEKEREKKEDTATEDGGRGQWNERERRSGTAQQRASPLFSCPCL